MILIRNGWLIDPAADREGEYDLLIAEGRVADVQPRGVIPAKAASEVIEASELWVVPGLIDLHVHLREPGFEWKETIASGCRAAVAGGFTTVCCMPNTDPVNDSGEITRFIIEKARAAGLARVLPIGAISIRSEGKQMAPFSEMRRAGCAAFSDDGRPVACAGLMRRALEWCRMLDAPLCCHEEDLSLSACGVMNESSLSCRLGLRGMPRVAEDVMVARDIELARTTGGRVHFCHVSSARSVELIRRAKQDGIPVTAEATPHHLLLTEEEVEGYRTCAKMSPPLRSGEDCRALWEGVRDGTIDAVASDHSPHEEDSKNVEFERAAFGLLGLQTSLPLLLESAAAEKISRRRLVAALSSEPARILGAELGSLKKGRPADVTLIEPSHRWIFDAAAVESKSINSPFLGRQMNGRAHTVLVEGRVVLRCGDRAGAQ